MSPRHPWLAVILAMAASCLISHPRQGHAQAEEIGSIGLRELIELALQNDPSLVALRSHVSVEEARKRAAVQWRDPEIRMSYSKDDNIQLDQPYTRSGSLAETVTQSSTREGLNAINSISSNPADPTGGMTSSEIQSFNEAGTSTETRTTNYTETVIPGATSDRIIRTETESRSTDATERGSENSTTSTVGGPGSQPGSEIKQSNSNGRSASNQYTRTTTDEIRHHGRDRFAEDETASVKVRFWIPKPWEKKALIEKAAKVVDLANYEIAAAERRVILEVRQQYETLQHLSKKLEASRSEIAIIEQHVANEQALLDAGGAFTLDQLSFDEIKIPGIQLAIDAAETELSAAKRVLAARVGLADGQRIRVTDQLLRAGIDLQSADLEYLTRMAFAHRGEVGFLKAEQAIAEADLEVVKSKRIPWFSFLEASYAQDATGGDFTNDNYGVQVGVTLPLFSWLAKDEKVVEARIQSHFDSLEANQKNIANEVAEAFQSVKEVSQFRARTEAAVAKHAQAIAQKAKGLEAAEDPAAKEKLRYESEIERFKFYDHILAADRLYNQALIRLEQALGADLDQVFNVEFEPLAGPVPAALQPTSGAQEESRKGLFKFLKK